MSIQDTFGKEDKMVKRVVYKGSFNGNIFDIYCYEGETLGAVWNREKQWFLPGSQVTITDNCGNTKTFMRGVKG